MVHTFEAVEMKLAEADFFLDKLAEEQSISIANFYFSAFVTAARSVTFTLQAVMNRVPGFAKWYAGWQAKMKEDSICRFFLTYRNDVQKVGEMALTTGTVVRGEGKKLKAVHFFGRSIDTGKEIRLNEQFGRALRRSMKQDSASEQDAVELSNRYMRQIVTLVADCLSKFAVLIDPEMLFTEAGLAANGRTVEDVEEDLGFPRGWTAIPGASVEKRLELLRAGTQRSPVHALVKKYCIK